MQPAKIKIYSAAESSRLKYIAGVILGDILGLSWEVITDKRKLGKQPVINYSQGKLTGGFKITPDPIMFENGISRKDLVIGSWKELPVFFQTSDDSDLPFDIFGASFFLVTRYEEYLPSEHDEHGRYKAKESTAYRNGFLDRPVVDMWCREFSRCLLKHFPNLVFRRSEYRSLLTIDTDTPFAFLGKNIIRSFGELIHPAKGHQETVNERYRVITGEQKDPFDVFDYMIDNIEKHNTDSRFFFPVGNRSKHDENPSWRNEEYRKLIRRIAARYEIGLHPSYTAGSDGSLIGEEISRLNSITSKNISISRFHYLKLFMPDSYSRISQSGISEDYSMGYHDEPGFRAGIARPFYFYNVTKDVQTKLLIIPFQIMDVMLSDYKKLEPPMAKEIIGNIIAETRKAGGLFVSIWHNTSLVDDQKGRGWREAFEYTLITQRP